ncbi:hypothetical protein SAMN05421819_4017 [Bryocella elongata]|uniref:Uncharacterized protein n=1 Tax=Bryocella elongata TaxID=863522 RepID=A0A1H6BXL2_9BACT|nr:hypothetical protein [Bryocella elongata]SEG65197.1 hypothetical protein SAMN05421819_4017 [Bryocella elongata]
MTLTVLFEVMFFVFQITIALGVAAHGRVDLWGHVVASILGLTIGVIWIVSVQTFLMRCERAARGPKNPRMNWLLTLAGILCLLWEIAGVALAGWLSATLLRHMT